jgi:hypothetical protein
LVVQLVRGPVKQFFFWDILELSQGRSPSTFFRVGLDFFVVKVGRGQVFDLRLL